MNTYIITGGAGFIGSHLVQKLLAEDSKIIVIDNFNDYYDYKIKVRNIIEALELKNPLDLYDSIISCGNKEKILKNLCDTVNELPNFRLSVSDIRNIEEMEEIFKKYKNIKTVIHLAAMAGVRPSFDNPLLYEEVNIKGTLNLLELMKKYCINDFIFASSSSVYGNNRKLPFSEADNLGNVLSPYALTKKTCEEILHLYHHNFHMNIAILRFFTVYGPRQRPDLAIHKFYNKMKSGEKIPFYGDGSTARDYTYIEDIISGIIGTIKYLNSTRKSYEIFNLGENHTVTLNEMIHTLEELSGYHADLEILPFQKGDMKITYADIEKSKNMLAYSPKTSFPEGIRKFLDYYNRLQQN